MGRWCLGTRARGADVHLVGGETELGVVDGLGLFGLPAISEQTEVVDAGGSGSRCRLGACLGVGVAPDGNRDPLAHGAALESDLDGGHVEGVEDDRDTGADQCGVDLEGVRMHRDRRRLGHPPGLGPQERLVERGIGRQCRRLSGEQPVDGRLARLGVDVAVIDGLGPGGEQPVQLSKVRRRPCLDLDKELHPDGLEDPLDLPPAFRSPGLGVHEAHAEAGACSQELLRDVGGAVVYVDHPGHAPRLECGPERCFEPDRVLRVPPAIADQRPGMVVDEREQVGLAPGDGRSVQGVAGPQVTGSRRLEPAEGFWRRPVGPGVQPEAGQVALDGALGGPVALRGADDLGHLRARPGGDLPLERLGHVQQALLGHGLAGARDGSQRVEPAFAIGPDPPVDRPAGHTDPSVARAGVVSAGQLPHKPASLADGQRLVGRLANQRVAEERDLSLWIVHGWDLLVVGKGETLAAHTGATQGELVLESSHPPVTTLASDHGGRGPKRRAATMPSTPTASIASKMSDPPGDLESWVGSSAVAHRMKCSRSGTAIVANRRSQPRTVETGRPRANAIFRWPDPLAAEVNAIPITAAASRRRTNVSSGIRTWVTPHDEQIDRRNRRRSLPTRRRISLAMPCPHGRSPNPQVGQASRPPVRSRSTATPSIPTMSTAELRLRQEEPSRVVRRKISARGLLRVSVVLTLAPTHRPPQTWP